MSEQEDGIKEDAMQESSWIRKAMDRSGSFCHDNVQRERERGMREVCRQRKKRKRHIHQGWKKREGYASVGNGI
jgi:hypothetical protein